MIREEINLDWVKQLNIAIRYIEDHLTGTIEYDELAKMLCCSTYQFQRMFAFMNNVPLGVFRFQWCFDYLAVLPRDGPLDFQHTTVEVDVRPFQPQQFAPP